MALVGIHISTGEDSELSLLEHPSSIVQANIPSHERTGQPVIAGTGETNTAHTYTKGSVDGVPASDITGIWAVDGLPTGTEALEGVDYLPSVGLNNSILSVIEVVANFPHLTATSNLITLDDPDVLPFPALLTQDQLDDIEFEEITDPEDPDADGVSGRRRLTLLADLPATTGFRYRWGSSVTDGGQPAQSSIIAGTVAGGPYLKTNALTPGVQTAYNILYHERLSDGVIQPAFPDEGTTGTTHVIALEALPSSTTFGQAPIPIQGLDEVDPPETGDWPAVPTLALSQARSYPQVQYTNKGGAGSNGTKMGNCALVVSYAAFKGDTSQHSTVISQLDRLLSPTQGVVGTQGPAAARETQVLALIAMARNTPEVWSQISAPKKEAFTAIEHALLVIHAHGVSDLSGSGSYITGFPGNDASVKTTGPNISISPLMNVVSAAASLGPSNARNYLDTVTMTQLREEVADTVGAGSQLYKTINWRNEGVTASQATTYYRSAASSAAPTDATIHTSIRNWKYFGGSLPNMELLCFPAEAAPPGRGLNRVLPPVPFSQGSNPNIGEVRWSALNNSPGYIVNGVRRGYVYNNGDLMPYLGMPGRSVYEWNGLDDGIRFSFFYGEWTVRCVNAALITMALSGNVDMSTPTWIEWLGRWRDANDIFRFIDNPANDVNCVAHANNQANGGAGESQPRWSLARPNWAVDANLFLWDAILAKTAAP